LAASKTPLTPPAAPAASPAIDPDTAQLDQIIGVKGQANGGVYQFGVPRRDPITDSGMAMAPVGPLGLATAIGFQPTGNGKAAITGDFVLTGDEVNPVITALRSNGIEVTAVHSHMLNEQAAAVLSPFLGERRCRKARQGTALRARQNGERKKLRLRTISYRCNVGSPIGDLTGFEARKGRTSGLLGRHWSSVKTRWRYEDSEETKTDGCRNDRAAWCGCVWIACRSRAETSEAHRRTNSSEVRWHGADR